MLILPSRKIKQPFWVCWFASPITTLGTNCRVTKPALKEIYWLVILAKTFGELVIGLLGSLWRAEVQSGFRWQRGFAECGPPCRDGHLGEIAVGGSSVALAETGGWECSRCGEAWGWAGRWRVGGCLGNWAGSPLFLRIIQKQSKYETFYFQELQKNFHMKSKVVPNIPNVWTGALSPALLLFPPWAWLGHFLLQLLSYIFYLQTAQVLHKERREQLGFHCVILAPSLLHCTKWPGFKRWASRNFQDLLISTLLQSMKPGIRKMNRHGLNQHLVNDGAQTRTVIS